MTRGKMRIRLAAAATASAIAVALLAGLGSASMASASTTRPATSVRAATGLKSDAPDSSGVFELCNEKTSDSYYGCAQANGDLHAVTLVSPYGNTLLSYNSTTYQFQQSGTDLCLEYNSGSSTYPVRMDTCNSSRVSQEWYSPLGGSSYEIMNGYSGTCLEGSEENGFGNPLTMSSCANDYGGEMWIFV
jgi:hypothetical protein